MSKGSNIRPFDKQKFDRKFDNITFQSDNLEPVDTPDKDLDDFMKEQPKKFSWRKTKQILRKVMNNPIMDFVITITPKPISNMLKWLKERLKEPSTYQGIAVLASAIGVSISPDLWQAIASVGAAVIGLVQVIKRELPKEE